MPLYTHQPTPTASEKPICATPLAHLAQHHIALPAQRCITRHAQRYIARLAHLFYAMPRISWGFAQ